MAFFTRPVKSAVVARLDALGVDAAVKVIVAGQQVVELAHTAQARHAGALRAGIARHTQQIVHGGLQAVGAVEQAGQAAGALHQRAGRQRRDQAALLVNGAGQLGRGEDAPGELAAHDVLWAAGRRLAPARCRASSAQLGERTAAPGQAGLGAETWCVQLRCAAGIASRRPRGRDRVCSFGGGRHTLVSILLLAAGRLYALSARIKAPPRAGSNTRSSDSTRRMGCTLCAGPAVKSRSALKPTRGRARRALGQHLATQRRHQWAAGGPAAAGAAGCPGARHPRRRRGTGRPGRAGCGRA